MVGDAGCERIHKEKCRKQSFFIFTFPRQGKCSVGRNAPAPALRGRAVSFYQVMNGAAVEHDVSTGLQLVSMLSLGAGSSRCGLVCPVSWVLEPSGCFQEFSSPEDKDS